LINGKITNKNQTRIIAMKNICILKGYTFLKILGTKIGKSRNPNWKIIIPDPKRNFCFTGMVLLQETILVIRKGKVSLLKPNNKNGGMGILMPNQIVGLLYSG
jgi:hypothetical protein